MRELNEFDKYIMSKKKRNKYPRTALDEALNYDKRFREHLESKKQQQLLHQLTAKSTQEQ